MRILRARDLAAERGGAETEGHSFGSLCAPRLLSLLYLLSYIYIYIYIHYTDIAIIIVIIAITCILRGAQGGAPGLAGSIICYNIIY